MMGDQFDGLRELLRRSRRRYEEHRLRAIERYIQQTEADIAATGGLQSSDWRIQRSLERNRKDRDRLRQKLGLTA